MKKLILSTVLAALLPVTNANAIGIDSMIKVAEDGEALFTVTNSDGYRQFISTLVSEGKVVDGTLEMTPYTRENIADWSAEVKPGRTVIDDNAAKTFRVVGKEGANDIDRIYQVTFVPTPYFKDGERPTHAVQMAIGFAPVIIVPANEDKPLKYEVKHQGDEIYIHNQGETFFNVVLDACKDDVELKERKKCAKVAYAMSGRKLVIPLEGALKENNSIQVDFRTNNNDFSDEFSLEKNTTRNK